MFELHRFEVETLTSPIKVVCRNEDRDKQANLGLDIKLLLETKHWPSLFTIAGVSGRVGGLLAASVGQVPDAEQPTRVWSLWSGYFEPEAAPQIKKQAI
ncbi:hypothetical protein GGTG_00329 [Gaeumannomyces tritici R3-111a-1]|uniref:Uncharacterized protein n=1 Tax=Gaeumannomyces tritici (strain R3-111a-1) TaxID=644352 RepID=J3NGD8_GAET3|nr:hypothetical protein GGTG_00329 [Gaeumannomyces tritici R3-111a-1]EJT80328.1 hypothetical protein GGTG_00329 [Gaeumannomyces tritici R3-111a-1]